MAGGSYGLRFCMSRSVIDAFPHGNPSGGFSATGGDEPETLELGNERGGVA